MRDDWGIYFLGIAREVATRSTCPRAQVGAVIVRDKRIIATGYNGSAPLEPHCSDVGCLVVDDHCVRTIHAEENALISCARFGIATEGARLYSSMEPCHRCRIRMLNAGITLWMYNS